MSYFDGSVQNGSIYPTAPEYTFPTGDIYSEELTKAMTWLGQQSDTLFIGQQVCYPGNSLFKTLEGVPMDKRIELPVAEEMQLGMSIGLAMTGKTVVSIFPRMDFLMCAMNQLVNHLDKDIYPLKGKVIIRTCVGSTKPMHPGVQHCGDYTGALETILKSVSVMRLLSPLNIMPAYLGACVGKSNTILVEYGDLY